MKGLLFGERWELHTGDCLPLMRAMPERSVDLVFGSPPYEDCRTYGIDFQLSGQAWVDWMVEIVQESLRICRGLVAFIVAGKTRSFRWSATPALLLADLHRRGVHLRDPFMYHRVGVPGSGGPDWLRHDLEWIVCAAHPGKLPWSDNTACGGPPKYQSGGEFSNRKRSGQRASGRGYPQVEKANPGNLFEMLPAVIKVTVGGGKMGHPLASENEAPFHLDVAEFFVRSFCPPEGITLDPFSGSATTGHACLNWGRRYLGIELRSEQNDIATQRLTEVEQCPAKNSHPAPRPCSASTPNSMSG